MRRSCCSRRPGGVPDGLCTHVTLSPGADPDRPDHLEPVVCRDVRWPGGDLQGEPTGPRGRRVELAERQPRRADPAYPCTIVLAGALLLAPVATTPLAEPAAAVRHQAGCRYSLHCRSGHPVRRHFSATT